MIAELKEQVAKAACFLFLWDKFGSLSNSVDEEF